MYFPHGFWTSNNLRNGLIAFWTFNNSGNIGKDDFNGFDLTSNGVINPVIGKLGNAVENTNDGTAYLGVTDASNRFNLTTDKTFCFWFKHSDAESGGSVILGKYSGTTNYECTVGLGIFNFIIVTTVTSYTASTAVTLLNNTWYMVTLRHSLSSKKISLQINNNSLIEETYTGNPQNPTQDFRALEEGAVGSTIDNLGVWNRVLTLEESRLLYNNENGLVLFSGNDSGTLNWLQDEGASYDPFNTSRTITFGNTTIAGSMIVAVYRGDDANTLTVTDNKGGSYTLVVNGSTSSIAIAVCYNTAGGAGHDVTFTLGTAGFTTADIIILEYKNIATTFAFDVGGQKDEFTADVSITTAATSQAVELIFGAMSRSGGAPTAGNGYVLRLTQGLLSVEDRMASSIGAQTVNFIHPESNAKLSAATFKGI